MNFSIAPAPTLALRPEEEEALRQGWPCDYCAAPLTPDNIEYHPGKSEITCHRTCYEQVRERMNQLGGAWGDNGWKPVPPVRETDTAVVRDGRRSEKYTLAVADKTFVIQFLPLFYQDDYTDLQLDALAQKAVYDVTFYLEDFQTPEGETVAGFGIMGTGDAFKVLGSVAHGIMKWVEEKHPDYLCWTALEPNRQKLYHRMVRYFEKRTGMRRLAADPFTGKPCPAGLFWIGRA